MSKVIDERVVSMQFDNKHFESNVQTSMSTLDKFKQKLNFSGASKGLESVSSAAKNVDMNSLGSGVETVRTKFSALQVMGVTALANITTAAVNAGARMVKALAIDPVMDGFREYEMTLNAVQTTMAGTGKTAEEVEKELKKLDEYADKTVYSTADMLNNLPKFTNAGVELEDATKAMIGIANATALAGGDAGKASIAFYNLGQAIGTGYLTRMDYNSINNAGIATMEWKEQMVDAAIAAGTLKKAGDDAYEAGGKTFTLQQLFIDGLQHQWATTDVMMKVFGDYGDEQTKIGEKAYAAAQDIKTFSMMMDSLKATAGTGWKDTWQLIFGDLEEAKVFWTGLNNFISGIITGVADFRNKVLEIAMGSPLAIMAEKVKGMTNSVKDAIEPLKDYAEIVDRIIRGDFGNQWDNGDRNYRKKLVEAEGYDYETAQNLVNERLGSSVRLTTDLTEAQKEQSKQQAKTIDQLAEMSEAQLKELGYTDDQIKSLKMLAKYAKEAGVPLSEFIKNLDEMSGRELLIESFKNAGKGLVGVFQSMKDAFLDIFPVSAESIGLKIYSVFTRLYNLSKRWDISENKDAIDKLTRSFKGLFAALDIILTIVGGPIKIVFKLLTQLLDAFDVDLLTVTAVIGDAIVKFHDWLDVVLDFTGIFEALVPHIKNAAGAVKDWFASIKNSDALAKFTSYLKDSWKAVKDWVKGIKDAEDIPKYIIQGLVNGLKNGAIAVWNAIVTLATGIIDKAKSVLGIHSPSVVFAAIGGFIISGLILGLTQGFPAVGDAIKNMGSTCINAIKSVDWGAVFSSGTIVAILGLGYKIADAFQGFAAPFDGFGEVLEKAAWPIRRILMNTAKVVKSFSKVMNAYAFNVRTEGIKNLAMSLLILVGAIAILTLFEPAELWNAVAIIAVLSAMLVALAIAVNKMSDASMSIGKNGLQINGLRSSMLSIGAAILLVAVAAKLISNIDPDRVTQAFLGLAGVVAAIGVVLWAYGSFVHGKSAQNIDKAGKTILKLGAAMLLLAVVAKIIANMSWEDMGKAGAGLLGLVGIVTLLMLVTRIAGKRIAQVGTTMLAIAGAIAILAFTAKLLADMSWGDMGKAAVGLLGLVGVIALLTLITKLAGGKLLGDIGRTLIQISGAILILTIVAKMIAKMSWGDMGRAAVGLLGLVGVIALLVMIVKTVGKDAPKIAGTLLAISAAIAILAVVAVLLGFLRVEHLAKGVTAMSVLAIMVSMMIAATRGATDCKNNLIVIAVAIAVMAGAVAALSFIDPARLAVATGCMATMMALFALVIKVAGTAQMAMGPLIVLTTAVAVIGGMLYLLGQLPIEASLSAAAALSMVLLAISASMVLISKFGTMSPMAMASVAVMTVVVIALAVILNKLSTIPIESALGVAIALSTLLMGLSVSLVILGVVGMMGVAALIGIGVLAALIVAMGALAIGAAWLMENVDGLQGLLDKGIPILVQIAGGLGQMIGAFVGGIVEQLAATLPVLGLCLSQFMVNATPFINGIKMVDGSVLAGVAIIAAAVIALTAADFIAGIGSFLGGGSSFADLGFELSAFMLAAMPFITMSKQIDPEIMTGVKTLAEAILILCGSNMLETITGWLGGESSLGTFGAQLGQLGTDLKTFVTNLGAFTEEQVTTVQCAGNAIKALAEAAKAIPNDGGWLGAILGENSIATFGNKLPQLGTDLKNFVTNLGTFTEEQVSTVDCAGRAIKALADAAKEIPNDGGWLGAILGENSISTFGAKLPQLGKDLKAFVANLGTFDESSIATVDCAGNAIRALAESAKTIPNEGGFWAKLAGDNSLADFGSKLPQLGTDLKGFVTNLGSFDNINTVNAACDAIESIAQLTKINKISDGLNDLGKKLKGFGEKIGDFVNAVCKVGGDKIASAISKTKEIIELAKTAAGTNIDSLKTFGKSLKNIAEDGVKGFVDEFANKDHKSKVTKAAEALMDAFIAGAEDKEDDVVDAFQGVAKTASKKIATKDIKDAFKEAGKDLVEGFANGIKNNKSLATDAGSSLGKAALKAAKEALDENSPSKEMFKVGDYAGLGFVNGLDEYAYKAYKSGENMADSARSGLSRAIAKVADIINSDIDAQPTIRPVLDLSDVRAGASSINGMFAGRTLSVNTRTVSAVAASMAGYQNGGNTDVISAIRGLGKDISRMPRNSYSVGNVTYDDGSNIATLVEALVREARVERRR